MIDFLITVVYIALGVSTYAVIKYINFIFYNKRLDK
jgi:hypothetical protein